MSFSRVLQSGLMEREVRSLWRQYEERSLRKLRHGWRLWKLHREFDFSPPNPTEWSFLFPDTQIPDCANCGDNCCQGPHNTVLLRLVDVALFVDRGWTDRFTLEKPIFSPETLAQKPMLQAMVNSFHWRVFPVLKQKEDSTCTFLSSCGDCTIHQHRPWICRVFPYTLEMEKKAVSWAPRCRWTVEGEVDSPVSKELRHAVFHSFYTEKICDMILVQVYREELEAIGITKWLNL